MSPSKPAEIPVAELDARLEVVLHRILPGALTQHLGPAVVQIMTNILSAPSQINSQCGAKDSCDSAQNIATKYIPSAVGTTGVVQAQPQDLRQVIHRALSKSADLYNLHDEANLFECGLDSLQLPALVSEINTFFKILRLDVS